jgi:outer membrane protein assembly factor BamB
VSPVSVAGGRVFTTGYRDMEEYCTAISEKDGKQIWSVKIGPAVAENSIMRWLNQRTPTIDGDRVYVVTAGGEYICLATENGKELWRKHFQKDFEGKKSGWGYCDFPLVDGDRVIIAPGGAKAAMVALDRKTGDVIWKCPFPGGETAAHTVTVVAEIGGVRQYLHHFYRTLIGVEAKSGKLLWQHEAFRNNTAMTHGPIVDKDSVFMASGYGVGQYLINIGRKDEEFHIEKVHQATGGGYVAWLGSLVQIGEHVYANADPGLICVERKTGTKVWSERLGRITYTVADGLCYLRNQKGMVTLAEIDTKGFRKISEFLPSEAKSTQGFWTFPVIANGKLYLREFDALRVYDIRDPDAKKRKIPDAGVFVPTPPDVVAKMLERANAKKADVVYDLGSGDGRIVIAAAKLGCTAVGVEWDKELVATSREKAKEAGVDKLATFELGDLFEADFSKADVVALYILPTMLKRLTPKLNKLKPGTRIVSHAFAIPGIKPAKVIELTSDEDDISRKIYLYSVPLVEDK